MTVAERLPPETLVRQCLESGTDLGLAPWQREGVAKMVGGMMRRENIRSFRLADVTSAHVSVAERLRDPSGPCSTCGQDLSVYCWECRYFWMERRLRKARRGYLGAAVLAAVGWLLLAVLLLK